MYRTLWFTLAVLTVCTRAIPANVDGKIHDISRREIAYENVWVHKNEPLEVCPTVEASMVPSLRSRMYDSSEEFDEELDDIFLPIKYHREVPWALNSPANIPGKYFIPTENNVYGPPGLIERDYLNAKKLNDIFDEPTDEELQVFFKLDDSHSRAQEPPKYSEGQKYFAYYQHPRWPSANETPNTIKIEDVRGRAEKEPPVALIYDPLVTEESELTAETHDIVDVEISERENLTENEGNPSEDAATDVTETKKEEAALLSDESTTPPPEPPTTTTITPKEDSSSQTKSLINDMLDSIRGVENFEKIEKTLAELIGDLEEASTSEFEAEDGEALKADELRGSAVKYSDFFLVNICGFNVFFLRYLSCHL